MVFLLKQPKQTKTEWNELWIYINLLEQINYSLVRWSSGYNCEQRIPFLLMIIILLWEKSYANKILVITIEKSTWSISL